MCTTIENEVTPEMNTITIFSVKIHKREETGALEDMTRNVIHQGTDRDTLKATNDTDTLTDDDSRDARCTNEASSSRVGEWVPRKRAMPRDNLNDPSSLSTNPDTRTEEDYLKQPTDALSGGHQLVALITDSHHVSYCHHNSQEWTVDSGASMNMTPSREMFRDNQSCTDGDFVSVIDKGELRIEGYGKLPPKVRKKNFILS